MSLSKDLAPHIVILFFILSLHNVVVIQEALINAGLSFEQIASSLKGDTSSESLLTSHKAESLIYAIVIFFTIFLTLC